MPVLHRTGIVYCPTTQRPGLSHALASRAFNATSLPTPASAAARGIAVPEVFVRYLICEGLRASHSVFIYLPRVSRPRHNELSSTLAVRDPTNLRHLLFAAHPYWFRLRYDVPIVRMHIHPNPCLPGGPVVQIPLEPGVGIVSDVVQPDAYVESLLAAGDEILRLFVALSSDRTVQAHLGALKYLFDALPANCDAGMMAQFYDSWLPKHSSYHQVVAYLRLHKALSEAMRDYLAPWPLEVVASLQFPVSGVRRKGCDTLIPGQGIEGVDIDVDTEMGEGVVNEVA